MKKKTKPPKTEQLYDVIIFDSKKLEIVSIAGKDMKLNYGHFNAEKRFSTVMDSINENYEPGIVPAGKYAKGKKLNRLDLE